MIKPSRISKEDFLKLNEDDVMFITSPGRMGDEDGSTFVIKKDNEYTFYRVEGWMYPNKDETISLTDYSKQFPKWYEAWKNSDKKDYNEKYKYIYMGFGNGLCVDHSIYNEYEPYLNKHVEKFLEKEIEKEPLQYAAIFNVWDDALQDMIKDKEKSKTHNLNKDI